MSPRAIQNPFKGDQGNQESQDSQDNQILKPKGSPRTSQDFFKIHPKTLQEASKTSSWHQLGSNLRGNWVQEGCNRGSKRTRVPKPKKCTSYWQAHTIRAMGHVVSSPHTIRKSFQHPSKNTSKIDTQTCSIFASILLKGYGILGSKLAPHFIKNQFHNSSNI